MQAIRTRFLGPTNHRGSRIIAECAAQTRTYHYQHKHNVTANHRIAAEYLRASLGWEKYGPMEGGELKDGSYVWVIVGQGA